MTDSRCEIVKFSRLLRGELVGIYSDPISDNVYINLIPKTFDERGLCDW